MIFLKTALSLFLLLNFYDSNAQGLPPKESFSSKHEPGFYLGSNFTKNETLLITPQAWMYLDDFYIESRYNHEEINSLSLHFGKSLEPFKDFELIPLAGFVVGQFNGISTGFNINYVTSKFFGFTQTQYCFSLDKKSDPFYYSSLGLNFPVYKGLYAGAAWQWLAQKISKPSFDLGPMISFKKDFWGFEFYSYNSWQSDRYWEAAIFLDFAK